MVGLILLAPAPCGAAGSGAEREAEAEGLRTGPPGLDLERLLRPRAPLPPPAPRALRAAKERGDWEAEFRTLRTEIAELENRIEVARARIREASATDWGFTPTGGGMPTDPEVLRLRAELRRDRQSLEASRRRLRNLEVEASLAGVPDDWRGTGSR